MKLLGIVIKNYNNQFVEEIFNLSPEHTIRFDFKTRELKIEQTPDYIPYVYGSYIYGITPIVGQNGCGKSTLLNLIGYNMQDKCNDNRLGFRESKELSSSYFIVFEARNSNYYLECFNYEPGNLTEVENGIDSEIIGTAAKAYMTCSGFYSVFISKNYEYKLISEDDYIDYKADEEIIYALSDSKIHRFEDQAVNYAAFENVFMRRTYISAGNSLKGEYIAFNKLAKRKMLSSNLRLKFDLCSLYFENFLNSYTPIVAEPTMYGNPYSVHYWEENIYDLLGNMYVSFANRMLSIAGKEDELSKAGKDDNYNSVFKKIMVCLAENSLTTDSIEKELFRGLDKQLEIRNICLEEYYRLNKRFIASLFMIRKEIQPSIGYFIITVPVSNRVDKNMKEFFERYDELANYYEHVFKNDTKFGDDLGYDEVLHDHVDYTSDDFKFDAEEVTKLYKEQRKAEPIMSFDTELMSDGEIRLIRLIGTILTN